MGKKPSFVAFAAKFILNVHDLNNEAVAGNVADIRLMDFVTRDNKVITAPAVSGRMLKHFHLTHMTALELSEPNPRLCDGCKVGEPIRPGVFKEDKVEELADISEEDAIKKCVICDTHGYLVAQAQALRRTSRALFSWLVPVLESEYASKQVLHSRVSRQITMRVTDEEKRKVQMLFSKSYASGFYAFVSVLDLAGLGYSESKAIQVLELDEWKRRAIVAIKAYIPLLTGHLGASLSHALPHAECCELLAVISNSHLVTVPFSPIYGEKYAEEYLGLLPKSDDFKAYTFGFDAGGAERKKNINEIFDEIIKQITSATA
jgi:CRISPR-associated protein Cst2